MEHHGAGLMGPAIVLAISLVVGTTGAPAPPIPFYCRLNEIQCPSNITKCIPVLGLCNGVKDCPDGSDENLAFCKRYMCDKVDIRLNYDGEQSRYFRSSKCLSGIMCTKDYIFPWRPDEEDAGTFAWCTGGPKQCADGSDENPKYCNNVKCETLDVGRKAVTCPSKNFCLIPKCDYCGRDYAVDLLCNGQKDCPDGSDEWPSFCKTNGCSYDSDENFRCTDGGCVQTDQICNGVKNCKDGSDESPSFCATYTCPQNGGRKCPGTNICLPDSAICDGKKTCPDGSDEKASFCRAYTPPAGFFKCKDGLQTVSKLVNVAGGRKELVDVRCDNVYDCKDRSDEAASLCKTFKCPEYRVNCPGNGACIYEGYICDGKVDCLDKSDESVSVCKKFTCPSYLIQCKKTGACVEGNYCDGYVDCADKTDEDPTFCRNFSCPAGTAKCPNFPFQCITPGLLCNGKKDCINGGDEDPSVCPP
eukprot:TRINITY_DN174_c0_g1_i1.p1 TRINITY_DN174_c0_g1~~TRINITY_DN174_c0_g1_i1.p1  ORF type:complete len:473 (+),score=62.56 TRINITY_DN174_c0_g1_i1:129-1547(+)